MTGFRSSILHRLPRKPPGLTIRALRNEYGPEVRAPSHQTIHRHCRRLLQRKVVSVETVGRERRYFVVKEE
ncbi:MAG: hypothetical protein AABX89_07435 [Candidatus Thermoplasmatota archaeon]